MGAKSGQTIQTEIRFINDNTNDYDGKRRLDLNSSTLDQKTSIFV